MSFPRRVPAIDDNIPPLTTGYHRNGVKVFIGGLPERVREESHLISLVKREAPHLEPFDPKVFRGGSTKGGSFIRVHNHEDADDLSKALDGRDLGGTRRCKCTLAPKKDDELPQKLFIGNIKGISGGKIRAIFERFGEVIDLNMIKSGGAIIEMACSCDALAAMDALNGKYKPDEAGPPIRIERSKSGDKEAPRPIIPRPRGERDPPSREHHPRTHSSANFVHRDPSPPPPLPPRATAVSTPRSYQSAAAPPPAVYDIGSRMEDSYMDRAPTSSYLDAIPLDIYSPGATTADSYLDRDRERGSSHYDRDRDRDRERRRISTSPPRYGRRPDARPVPPAAPPPRFNEATSPPPPHIPVSAPTPDPAKSRPIYHPDVPIYDLHAAAVGLHPHPPPPVAFSHPPPPLGYCPPAEELRSDQRGPPGANLFIKGFPESWGDFDLRAYFKEYGQLVSVKVYEDRETKQSKDFGFVSYASADQAATAVAEMNGRSVQGKVLKVTLKS